MAQDIRFLLFLDTENISTVFISIKTRILIKLSKLFKLELVCSKYDSGNFRAGKKVCNTGRTQGISSWLECSHIQ